jgi:hypothetical protein
MFYPTLHPTLGRNTRQKKGTEKNTLHLLQLVCSQNFKVRKPDFLGYESTQNPIVDLDNGGPIFLAWSRKSSRLTMLKNWTSKIQGEVEAFKKGYGGGGWNIEGALKTVDLEKILSPMYLGRIFLKLHV